MKINFKKILIYVILFYIIYTPTTSENMLYNYNVTVPIISILLLIASFKKGKITLKKNYVVFISTILLSAIYCWLIYCLRIKEVNFSDTRIIQNLLLIFYMLDVYILSNWINKDKNKNEFFNMVVNLAVFQGIICILMVIFPSLHQIALNSFYYKGSSIQNIYINMSRIYGIFFDYTFSTPIYHGFLAAILFNQYLKTNDFKMIIKCMLIMITVLLNGRTGLVIFFVSSLIYLIYYCFFKRKVFLTMKVLGVITIVILTTIISLKTFVPHTYNYIFGFFEETVTLISKNEYSGNYAILKEHLFFPKDEDLIFGIGYRVYGGQASKYGYSTSDIGYVNDLFQGGLIYVCLLYFSIFCLILKEVPHKEVAIALIVSLLIANYKGEIFHSIAIIFLVMLLCISGPIPYLSESKKVVGGKNES